jgi:hypothetical protein
MRINMPWVGSEPWMATVNTKIWDACTTLAGFMQSLPVVCAHTALRSAHVVQVASHTQLAARSLRCEPSRRNATADVIKWDFFVANPSACVWIWRRHYFYTLPAFRFLISVRHNQGQAAAPACTVCSTSSQRDPSVPFAASEVLTAVTAKIIVFWNVTTCSLSEERGASIFRVEQVRRMLQEHLHVDYCSQEQDDLPSGRP